MKGRDLHQRAGDAIRARRESLAMSQEAFADKIGMHRTYYSAIERGEKNPTLTTLERVCKGLGVKVWEVMRDADD
jgi:transcriptional regulator with XRE-family HTH domain